MAVELIGTDEFGRAQYKGLSSDTKPNAEVGSTFIETDTKNKYEQRATGSAGWVNTDIGGAANINHGFKLSSYTAELSVTAAGVTVARATGTTHSLLKNYGATNFLRYGFGTDDTTALVNAALGPRVLVGEIVKPEDLQWPDNATHMGLIADTATVTAYLGQGTMN